MLEEQQGTCVSGAESKGEKREEVRTGRGQEQVVQDIVDPGETWVFTLRKVGAIEACGQRKDGT